MSLAATPSHSQHQQHRIGGLATLRRLTRDLSSTFSRHLQATWDALSRWIASSIYAERLLSGNEIRVLHIRPSSRRSRRLECELKLVNLDESPVYNALSYVWGTDPPSVTIICNGQRLKIREELSHALVRLRLEDTTQIIWADALCINQDDNQEKNHQVPLMSKIFSQAARVNVWLGHGDEIVIREAFGCCRLVANACWDFSLEHDMDLDDDETHGAVEVPMTIFTPMACRSLTDLFERPLSSRVWCIQEIKLAQDAQVVWGEQYLPWAEVGLTALWIFNKSYRMANSDEAPRNLLEEVCIGDADTIYELNPGSWSLLGTLSRFRKFQSTDPRDKVYGLIGLVRSPSDGDLMMPDYEKSTAQAFTDTALHTITSTKNLVVFTHVAHHADYDGDYEYRSWAPRWDIPHNNTFIGHAFEAPEHGACNGREAQFVLTKHSGNKQLSLTGIFHAKVITVDIVFDMSKSDGLQMYQQVVELYEGIDWNAPMSDVALPVLARTLSTGHDMKSRYINRLDKNSRRAHYAASRRYLEWYRDPTADFDSLRGDALEYHNQLRRCSRNRRFFWTSKKDYGIGPACMREGDIVVVLYGGSAPFVLRRKGDKFLMLGEAYVDSIMNGQLVKEVEKGRRQEQEFCLI